MFGSLIGIISALSGIAAGVGKKVKQSAEADMDRPDPQGIDAFDALNMTSEALQGLQTMGSRSGFRRPKRM